MGACKLHGGSTPSHEVHHQRAEAKQLLGTLGVVADVASLPPLVVEAELQLSAAKQLHAVRWLELQVGDLHPGQVEISPWPKLLAAARRDCDRLLVEMVRLGLDARRVQLAEDEQQVFITLMTAVLEAMVTGLGQAGLLAAGMDDERVRAVAHQALRVIEGESA